jgi:hypothetical protein
MNGIYLHGSMFGTYRVPCIILDSRRWTRRYMTQIQRDFGLHGEKPTWQYEIVFFDEYMKEDARRWVNDNELEMS